MDATLMNDSLEGKIGVETRTSPIYRNQKGELVAIHPFTFDKVVAILETPWVWAVNDKEPKRK